VDRLHYSTTSFRTRWFRAVADVDVPFGVDEIPCGRCSPANGAERRRGPSPGSRRRPRLNRAATAVDHADRVIFGVGQIHVACGADRDSLGAREFGVFRRSAVTGESFLSVPARCISFPAEIDAEDGVPSPGPETIWPRRSKSSARDRRAASPPAGESPSGVVPRSQSRPPCDDPRAQIDAADAIISDAAMKRPPRRRGDRMRLLKLGLHAFSPSRQTLRPVPATVRNDRRLRIDPPPDVFCISTKNMFSPRRRADFVGFVLAPAGLVAVAGVSRLPRTGGGEMKPVRRRCGGCSGSSPSRRRAPVRPNVSRMARRFPLRGPAPPSPEYVCRSLRRSCGFGAWLRKLLST